MEDDKKKMKKKKWKTTKTLTPLASKISKYNNKQEPIKNSASYVSSKWVIKMRGGERVNVSANNGQIIHLDLKLVIAMKGCKELRFQKPNLKL